MQRAGKVIPVKVKAKENLQAKSLRVLCKKYELSDAVRSSMSNYREQEWMVNVPLDVLCYIFVQFLIYGEESMSELTSMMNIGKEMERKLTSVGIDSTEKLIELGSKEAFMKLKQAYPNVCLVHLYTLEGAIHNIEYNCLSEDTKKELKEFSDFLKK